VSLENLGLTDSIYDTLAIFDGASINRFRPQLATAWESNAAKSVWTFHLRHGVKFHTGRCCMTASDVKYSIARMALADLPRTYLYGRYMSDPMRQIKVVDDYTIEFDFSKPQPTFLNAVGADGDGEVLDSVAMKAHSTKKDPWAHNWATDHDAGTGPYILQQWQHNVQETLVRFPDYWGGWSGHHFSTIVLQEIPEISTRRELVERGQVDIALSLTAQDAEALARNPALRVSADVSGILYITMTEHGPLASPLARQALSYAFNYNAYLRAAFLGYARRAYGPLASNLTGYDIHMFHYQTDLTKARQLLQQAGVKPGTTLSFLYIAGQEPGRLGGLILQAQLAQLGIKVTLQGVDEPAFLAMFFGDAPPGKRPDLMFYGWGPDYDDPWDECVQILASSSAGSAGGNGGFYHNARLDALLAEMKNAGRAMVIRDAHQLQDITSRVDPPSIWVAEPAWITVMARNLHGVVFNPIMLLDYRFYPMYRS
jgi:peptide/nickel transport system substrate-binding protein